MTTYEEKKSQFSKVIKRKCHSCKCEVLEGNLVACQSECCHKFFCQKCLTSRYKYSRAKAAKLPSFHWKCPVCARHCYCDDCLASNNPPKKRRLIKKIKLYTNTRRKYKRARLKKMATSVQQESSKLKCTGCKALYDRMKVKTCFSCGTAVCDSCSSSASYSCCTSPIHARPHLPPPSLLYLNSFRREPPIGNFYAFHAPVLPISEEKKQGSMINPFKSAIVRIGNPQVSSTSFLKNYEAMSVEELLRIAFTPFARKEEELWPKSSVK